MIRFVILFIASMLPLFCSAQSEASKKSNRAFTSKKNADSIAMLTQNAIVKSTYIIDPLKNVIASALQDLAELNPGIHASEGLLSQWRRNTIYKYTYQKPTKDCEVLLSQEQQPLLGNIILDRWRHKFNHNRSTYAIDGNLIRVVECIEKIYSSSTNIDECNNILKASLLLEDNRINAVLCDSNACRLPQKRNGINIDSLRVSLDYQLLLVLVKRELQQRQNNLLSKKNMLDVIDFCITELNKEHFMSYKYFSNKREPITFVHIRHTNDLQTPGGLIPFADQLPFFQRNLDRDYTGSMRLEFGTNKLRHGEANPQLKYQTLFYGFDVHTPYFRADTPFFKQPNASYTGTDYWTNKNEMPHGSFEYIGISSNKLSRTSRYRSSSEYMLGVIGSNIGKVFQQVLHLDVANSPQPRGYASQIGGGKRRLGLQWNQTYEIQVPASLKGYTYFIIPSFKTRLGTYKTQAALGLGINSRSFLSSNHHNVRKIGSGFVPIRKRFSFSTSLDLNYNIHNSMLEGYGIVNTNATEYWFGTYHTNDTNATTVLTYLRKHSALQNFFWLYNFKASYSTQHITVYYSFFSRSSEVKKGAGLPIAYQYGEPDKAKAAIYLHKWFQYASIGFVIHGF